MRKPNVKRWIARLVPLALLAGPITALDTAPAESQSAGKAKNVILMVGDGMGETHVHATRLHYLGRDGRLNMEQLPAFNQATTFANNSVVTDSAAAATALATGVITDNGKIAQDPAGASTLDRSLLKLAQADGKATGLVTEVQLAHATPAPFAATAPSRRAMNEIAAQYLDNQVDVLLGGGESNFYPSGTPGAHCSATETRRMDGRNLAGDFAAAGYEVVTDRNSLMAADGRDGILGLFACENMSYSTAPDPNEPTTADKTAKALEVLSDNPRGFFLVVERGKIDWTAEDNDLPGVLAETRDFDNAVAVAREFVAANPNTLLVVTSDHEAGGMHLVFPGPNPDADVTTSADGQPMYVTWATGPGHTAVPVAVRASGAGAERIRQMNGSGHLADLYRTIRDIFIR